MNGLASSLPPLVLVNTESIAFPVSIADFLFWFEPRLSILSGNRASGFRERKASMGWISSFHSFISML